MSIFFFDELDVADTCLDVFLKSLSCRDTRVWSTRLFLLKKWNYLVYQLLFDHIPLFCLNQISFSEPCSRFLASSNLSLIISAHVYLFWNHVAWICQNDRFGASQNFNLFKFSRGERREIL